MSMGQLPNKEKAWVEEAKVTAYLLKLDHPEGGSKAKFFISRGFVAENWENMADALRHHAKNNPVSKVRTTSYGTKYVLECSVPTPDKSSPCIRTVWEVTSDDPRPRLITAYPLPASNSAAS